MASGCCDVCGAATGPGSLGVYLEFVPHDPAYPGRDLGSWTACSYDCLVLLAERLRDSALDNELEWELHHAG